MNRILVTGGNGQLGQSLKRELAASGIKDAIFIDIEDLDITDKDKVDEYFSKFPIDVLINCAAYTAVDKAEEDKENAYKVNTEAPSYLGEAAAKYGFRIIHISTDYVFSGVGSSPYNEEMKEEEIPATVYGETKLEGERKLQLAAPDSVIIRTSWLYSEYGRNFVKAMIEKAKEGKDIRVVNDQRGCPTYAGDLANGIISVLKSDKWVPGIYHYCNKGVITWYDFAASIFRHAVGSDSKVNPVSSAEYPTPARRPAYSAMDTTKIQKVYKVDIPEWEVSLKKMIDSK